MKTLPINNNQNGFSVRKLLFTAFWISVLILGLGSCTEKIDIELDDSYTRLVVEGSVTTDAIQQTVKLSLSTDYYYPEAPPAVENAEVFVFDGTDSTRLWELWPGTYKTEKPFAGVPGKTYNLYIKLNEAVGGFSEYTASSFLNPVGELDSVNLDFHPEWGQGGIWEVKCYVQEPPRKDWYRFMIYKNNKLFTDKIENWFVIDDKFFNGSYASGATVSYLRQNNPYEKLNVGDTITVEVDNISQEFLTYITQVQAEIQGNNPMFGGPPANAKGNVSNGAIGFFAAYSTTRKSTVTPPF